MPKKKTHKGLSKKLTVRNSGSIKIGHPSQRHNTGKKNAASNRNGRTMSTLSKSDQKRIKEMI